MASIINASSSSGLVQTADTSGDIALQNNGTTVVTVTGGNVGIGTTSPETKLHVTQSNDALPALQLRHGDGDFILMEEGGGTDLFKFTRVSGTNDLQINNLTANNIRFATNNTERMRIDSDGSLIVGRTTSQGKICAERDSNDWVYNSNSTGSGTKLHFRFTDNSSVVGSITSSGSTTSYNTSSDYRLKENIAPMQNALSVISQLKPVTYKWKTDGKDGQGFIAHELQEAFPDAVFGVKDAVDLDGNIVPQGIDTSFLVATLTAAIQELKAELDATKAEVATAQAEILALKGTA